MSCEVVTTINGMGSFVLIHCYETHTMDKMSGHIKDDENKGYFYVIITRISGGYLKSSSVSRF